MQKILKILNKFLNKNSSFSISNKIGFNNLTIEELLFH